MTVLDLSDIYGRHYLINFAAVKSIQISDSEENGDLIITYSDRTKEVISVGLDREDAFETLERISRVVK